MRITAALLKAWKRDGQDRTLRSMIVNSEWEELCDLAIKGLASPPEAEGPPPGWKLVCEKCGIDQGEHCGWPSNCRTGQNRLSRSPSE